MKRVIFIAVLLLFAGALYPVKAQDVITKKDGSKIRAKIVETDNSIVKYKLYDNQTGPNYVVYKSDLRMIEYESGRRVLFEEPAEGTPTVSVPPETKYTPQTQGNTGNTPPQPVYTQPPVTQYPYASSDWKTLMQLKAPEIYRQYQKKARMAKTGWWIAGAGALVVVVGAATGEKETVTNGASVQVRLNGTGGAIAAAGSLVAITGVTVAIIGTTKRNRIKNDFISQSSRYTQKSPLQSPHFEIRTNGLAFVF